MKYLIFSILSLFLTSVYAQNSTTVRDFETWNGVSLKKSFLDKKLSFKLTEEIRLKNNSTTINNFFTELESSYDLHKRLSVSVGYRFIKDNRKNGYINMGRFYSDLNFNHKIDRFKFDYRFRFQHQQQLGMTISDGDYPEVKYRLKAQVAYNIKKWKLDPYISGEIFFTHQKYQLNYISGISEPVSTANAFEKIRVTLGTSYEFNKTFELGAFYRIAWGLKSYPLYYNTPSTTFIAGLQLNIKL